MRSGRGLAKLSFSRLFRAVPPRTVTRSNQPACRLPAVKSYPVTNNTTNPRTTSLPRALMSRATSGSHAGPIGSDGSKAWRRDRIAHRPNAIGSPLTTSCARSPKQTRRLAISIASVDGATPWRSVSRRRLCTVQAPNVSREGCRSGKSLRLRLSSIPLRSADRAAGSPPTRAPFPQSALHSPCEPCRAPHPPGRASRQR